VSERLTQCEHLKVKLERSVQSHMEREQKLLAAHEADITQAAQLNERLRAQLAEREAELTHHRDDFKKKVCCVSVSQFLSPSVRPHVKKLIIYLELFAFSMGKLN